MSLTTQLDEAEDGLLAVIIARQAANPTGPLAGVAITLGDPGAVRTQDKHVWISEDATGDTEPESTGADSATFTEQMDLRVVVFVRVAGDDYAALRNAAHGLAEEVDRAVQADRSLVNAVEDAWVAKVERQGGARERDRIMAMGVTVHAWAYLS